MSEDPDDVTSIDSSSTTRDGFFLLSFKVGFGSEIYNYHILAYWAITNFV